MIIEVFSAQETPYHFPEGPGCCFCQGCGMSVKRLDGDDYAEVWELLGWQRGPGPMDHYCPNCARRYALSGGALFRGQFASWEDVRKHVRAREQDALMPEPKS